MSYLKALTLLLSPESLYGAGISKSGSKTVLTGENPLTWVSILLWVAELTLLALSVTFGWLLFDQFDVLKSDAGVGHSDPENIHGILLAQAILYTIRGAFVTAFVVMNLLSSGLFPDMTESIGRTVRNNQMLFRLLELSTYAAPVVTIGVLIDHTAGVFSESLQDYCEACTNTSGCLSDCLTAHSIGFKANHSGCVDTYTAPSSGPRNIFALFVFGAIWYYGSVGVRVLRNFILFQATEQKVRGNDLTTVPVPRKGAQAMKTETTYGLSRVDLAY